MQYVRVIVCIGMVWYGMGALSRNPHWRCHIKKSSKSTSGIVSIAVLMHYHRLLRSGLVGLVTRSPTEELQTRGLYRTIMCRLTALVLISRLTMDVKQSKKSVLTFSNFVLYPLSMFQHIF